MARIRRCSALASAALLCLGAASARGMVASASSAELEDAYASVHAWIDESLASDDPAAASLARSQATLAFEAARKAMMVAEGGVGGEGRERRRSSPSVLASLEADGEGAAAADAAPGSEGETDEGEGEEGLWLRSTATEEAESDEGARAAAASTPPRPSPSPPSTPLAAPPPRVDPASPPPPPTAAPAAGAAGSSGSGNLPPQPQAASDAGPLPAAAVAASAARAEQARAAVIAATTFSEINEQGMDAVRPPRFCSRAGVDAFPPPMAASPPACDAADPYNPSLFLRKADGGAFSADSPTAITSSGQLQTAPEPQWYQFMFLASLPYFPLPAPPDDPQYDDYRGNADACLQAMGLSFPPARFVANVTSAVAEAYYAVRRRAQEKVEAAASAAQATRRDKERALRLPPWQRASSDAAAADATAASSAAAAAAAPTAATTAETEFEAGLAKALVFHSRSGTDVFVVFRGTMSRRDFDHINLVVYPTEAGEFYGASAGVGGDKVFVHAGYHKATTLLMPRIEQHLRDLSASGAVSPGFTVWFSGHSMGASLATLGALRYHSSSTSPSPGPLPRLGGVYLLSSPRVMWNDASQRFYNARLGPITLRFSYQGDVVADAPPRDWGYLSVGSGVAACADDDEARKTGLERLAGTPLGLDRGDGCNTRENALPSLQNVVVHRTRDALFGPSYKGTIFEWARYGGGRHFRSLMWDGFLRGQQRIDPTSLSSPGMSCVARALSGCPGLANGCFHILRCGLWGGGNAGGPKPYCGASCTLDASCSPASSPSDFTGAYDDPSTPSCLNAPQGDKTKRLVREPRTCRSPSNGTKAGIAEGLMGTG